MNKSIIRFILFTLTILLMLSVWPLCLIRKTVEVSSNMNTTYGITERYICHDVPFVQHFEAQTSKLDYFDFKFFSELDTASMNGKFYITLADKNGGAITEKEIGLSDINIYFWHVDINERLKKGEKYTISITVDEEFDNIFKSYYTTKPEDDAPGSIFMCIGEEIVDGQGLVRYGYGYPLNVKNIICIWSFIITIGLSLILGFDAGCKKKINNKPIVFWEKAWELLHKYQLFILIVEMLGILLLAGFLCRNRAINWDESFSYMMVTKLSLREMIHATALDMHPPLYYILLRGFAFVFGSQITTLKLMSVVVSGCTMLLGVTLIRKNWGARVAFLFNLVIGLGTQFIFNATNIRMYGLALFFVTWCALLAHEIIKEKGAIHWILFVVAGLGGVYTHYFAVVPLILIYGYLLIGVFLERKEYKSFCLGCVTTIAGYIPWLYIWYTDSVKGIDEVLGHLPWLTVVLHTFNKDFNGKGIYLSKIDFPGLCEWMYSTNIKSSVLMGVVLVVVGIFMLIWEYKKYSRRNRMFLAMCFANLPISYILIALVASSNEHFFDNRYIYASLGIFWLFVMILFSQKGKLISCFMAIYLMISVLSSYTIQNSVEVATGVYIDNAYSLLEQVRDEKIVLYNFPTFHILYGAHLPDKEFVMLDEMEWDKWNEDHIYLISWGGSLVSEEIREQYNIQYITCGTLNFENGYTDAILYRLEIGK